MDIKVLYSTIIVSDMKASLAFYRDTLGFSEGYHVDLPVGQITIMQSPGGACVELIESKLFPVGMYSIGMDVENLDEVIAHIEARGGKFFGEIVGTTVGRQIFALDPDGVKLCLIEHTEDYKEKYMI